MLASCHDGAKSPLECVSAGKKVSMCSFFFLVVVSIMIQYSNVSAPLWGPILQFQKFLILTVVCVCVGVRVGVSLCVCLFVCLCVLCVCLCVVCSVLCVCVCVFLCVVLCVWFVVVVSRSSLLVLYLEIARLSLVLHLETAHSSTGRDDKKKRSSKFMF